MKEEDSELSDDLAENTQVRLLVIENSTAQFVLLIFIGPLVTCWHASAISMYHTSE